MHLTAFKQVRVRVATSITRNAATISRDNGRIASRVDRVHLLRVLLLAVDVVTLLYILHHVLLAC